MNGTPSDLVLARSAERLALLLRKRAPIVMVDFEVALLVGRLAMLVGPIRLRQWIDQAVDVSITALGTTPR